MRSRGMHPVANYEPPEKRILIVDDEQGIAKPLAEMLSSHGYKAEVAGDGFEAGVKVAGFKPGPVILDLFMSGIDGFEVCRQIKGNPETSRIKVLTVTGYDTPENRERIMALGADDYLAKPVAVPDLLQRVKSLLNSTGGKKAKK